MLRIFQVGDTRLQLYPEEWPGENYEVTGESTPTLNAPLLLLSNTRFQSDRREYVASGLCITENGLNSRQLYQRLKSLAGLPTYIFAYEDSQEHDLLWMMNYGVIRFVDASEESRGYLSLELSIEVQSLWEPINRYIWHFSDSDPDWFTLPETTSKDYGKFMRGYPVINEVLGSPNKWVRRKIADELSLYDPELWRVFSDNAFPVNYGRAWCSDLRHRVYVDHFLYGAPPSSIYGLTNLTNSGSITIEITQTETPFDVRARTTVVNLDATHSALSGGLLPTDKLFIGDTPEKPGIIVRGTDRLNAYPVVEYEGLFPGVLGAGKNEVRVTGLGSAKIAWNHIYRRI